MKRSLTGVKPSNAPHIGNYIGAIRPALEMAREYESFFFVADYHALTTLRDPAKLRAYSYDVTASWLACGLDPERIYLYRQSDRPEVFELAWVLSCVLATGQLERGHAYKDAREKGESPNAGLFNYPVLMAADILLYDADVVPVGKDQQQHLELTRDVATRVNHLFGEGVLKVPDAVIPDSPLVPGIDGEKMSKSRGNTIPLFVPEKQLRKTCMRIVTGSEALDDAIDAHGSTMFEIFRLVAPDRAETVQAKLRSPGFGWGHAKQELFEVLEALIAPIRTRFEALRGDEAELDRLLERGAERVEPIARETIDRVRRAVGVAR